MSRRDDHVTDRQACLTAYQSVRILVLLRACKACVWHRVGAVRAHSTCYESQCTCSTWCFLVSPQAWRTDPGRRRRMLATRVWWVGTAPYRVWSTSRRTAGTTT